MNALFHLLKKINGLMFRHLNDTCIKHGLTAKQFLLLRFFYLNQNGKKEKILQAKIQNDFRKALHGYRILQTLKKAYNKKLMVDQRKRS